MSTRPQCSTANRNPAAPVLAAKQNCRPAAEVAREKAKLEAKQRALQKQNEDNLRQLQEIQCNLDVQEKENAAHAARPPPEQPVVEKPAGAPLTPLPVKPPRPRPASKANQRAVIDDDSIEGTPIGQRIQPGCIKRLRREDVEAYGAHNSAVVTGKAPDGVADAKAQKPSDATADVSKAQASSKVTKKQKSEGAGEDEPAKKGKPSYPSGPTVAAAAKFALPFTSTPPSSVSQPPSISAPAPAMASNTPQGVYVNNVGGFELDDVDASPAEHEGPAPKATTGAKNIIQLEVVDVAANPVLTAQNPTEAAPTTTPVTPMATPRGGWTMRHLEPILGSFNGNFTHIFTPKLINFISNTASGPWKLTGVNLVKAMEDLVAESFPEGLTLLIAPRQPFYEVGKQKLSEYCNGVGNEAVEVVSRYMQSRRFPSAEARAEYVAWATRPENGYLFRYERIALGDDGKTLKKHGLYQGTLIAETFVYHLTHIGKTAEQIRDWPCNALALTTAAVERALKMWGTGSFVAPPARTEEAKFSDKMWGSSAQQYLEGITNLSEEKWDKILAKADKALRGYSINSDDDSELDDSDERDAEDIPLTGRAGIDDDDDDNDNDNGDEESRAMEGVETTGVALAGDAFD
ncbi:hypothetical protein GSI_07441 [Ganoderma sinense ZZ0214-1]|uniref:DUF6532 domain-containing protein n=1 Tax=Ganoderma sinense ZZ0214-1 TaxID=1077348 RepID=A0A2G8S922_9APHY|nr:hypothetical protein GSI_07441 [Ganoderma sinense ZZ0214-1]